MTTVLTPEFTEELTAALKSVFEPPSVRAFLTEDLERAKKALVPYGFSAGPFEWQISGTATPNQYAQASCRVKAPLWASFVPSGAPDFELRVHVNVGARLAEGWLKPGTVCARVNLQRYVLVYEGTPEDFPRVAALASASDNDEGGDFFVASGEELGQCVSSLLTQMQEKKTALQRDAGCVRMVEAMLAKVEP